MGKTFLTINCNEGAAHLKSLTYIGSLREFALLSKKSAVLLCREYLLLRQLSELIEFSKISWKQISRHPHMYDMHILL